MPIPSRFGPEFHVNTTTPGDQSHPSVTALPNGGYVVVWDDRSATGGDSDSAAVRGQVYRADGTPFG
jgi:trimeric autotransporter adhesin